MVPSGGAGLKKPFARGDHSRMDSEAGVYSREAADHWFKKVIDRIGRSAVPSKQNSYDGYLKIMYEHSRNPGNK
jgi:hypothetical protein